jgi:DNA-binding FadR family transcriptional regulator
MQYHMRQTLASIDALVFIKPEVQIAFAKDKFDAQTVAELLQIRIWLETSVIGEAVKRIRPGDLERLGAVLDKWEASIHAGRGFFELDEEFHHVLYAVLGNETLIRLFDAFWVSFASLENEAIPNSDPYRELETHRAILEAIRSRDADRARDQLLRHFESVQEWVREYIRLSAAEGRGRAR